LQPSEIVIGRYVTVIANCPACGTHYKHPTPLVPARGRCGRCDTTFDLSRLRPYRIVAAEVPKPEDVARALRHLPIGLDDPTLATTIARNVDRQESPHVVALPHVMTPRDAWESDDPLPPIPEMATLGAFEASVPPVSDADILLARDVPRAVKREASSIPEAPLVEGRATTFVLWLATGAIVGTGASWTLGGTTLTGVVAGTVVGAVTGWGWGRWMSPK